ncbi:MAG: hypothetical protein ACRD2W_14835 [Acidimicrobiales bacterium]
MRRLTDLLGGVFAVVVGPFIGLAVTGLVGLGFMIVLGILSDGCSPDDDPNIPKSCEHLRDDAFMECYLES